MTKGGLILKNNSALYMPYGDVRDRSFLMNYCTAHEEVKKQVWTNRGFRNQPVKEARKLYKVNYDKYRLPVSYQIPRGIVELLPDNFRNSMILENLDTNNINVPAEVDFDYIRQSLQPESGFDLRVDQVMAVNKILRLKRGVCQLPTGAGKTEIMASCIRILHKFNPDVKVLVIEPTDILTSKTAQRFSRYQLDATTYKESRNDLSHTVTVSHVASLLNDIEANPDLLNGIHAVFYDESHHLVADTWMKINDAVRNAEYSVGMSALAIDEKNIGCRDLSQLSYTESLIIGSSGQVIMWIPPRYYIDNGILATPVIMQLTSVLPAKLATTNNWHELRKEGICSERRTRLTAESLAIFHKYGRKSLVLVGVKDQAYQVAEELVKLGITDVAISFGGNQSYAYNPEYDATNTKSKMFIPIKDAVSEFDKGTYSVVLGTSHMDEGVDVSNLDVCVLAGGGKKDRRIVQRIGRALRLTKAGKYAYIIDFNDINSGVLTYHSAQRMGLFKNMIEVPADLIYENISLDIMESEFIKLEGLDKL